MFNKIKKAVNKVKETAKKVVKKTVEVATNPNTKIHVGIIGTGLFLGVSTSGIVEMGL